MAHHHSGAAAEWRIAADTEGQCERARGNVGEYAVQLAHALGARVVAIDRADAASNQADKGDAVLDLVGGETQSYLLSLVRRGGIFVSAVAPVPADLTDSLGIRSRYFIVDVTTAALERLSERFERGEIVTQVGTVLPLDQARQAHEMLAGSKPKSPGKIVLQAP